MAIFATIACKNDYLQNNIYNYNYIVKEKTFCIVENPKKANRRRD